jgi:hypothetical protein
MFARVKILVGALRSRLLQLRSRITGTAPSTSTAVGLDGNGNSDFNSNSNFNTDCHVAFATLSVREQSAVKSYLASVAEVLSLLSGIQLRGRAVDHDLVLSNFAKHEADYVSSGFMPFIPGALKASGLTSLEPEAIDRSRLVRRSAGENYACFAQAMRLQVARLLRSGQVLQLDSSVAQQRLNDLCDAARADQSERP